MIESSIIVFYLDLTNAKCYTQLNQRSGYGTDNSRN